MLSDFLEQLESLPQDIPSSPAISDPETYLSALRRLLDANPTPAGRRTVLQAITLVPVDASWDDDLLIWARDDSDLPVVIKLASHRLSDGSPSGPWFQLLYDQNQRAHSVLLQWGTTNFDDFCSVCDTEYSCPTSRIPILLLLLAVLHANPYIPGSPAAQTLMAALPRHQLYSSILRGLLLDTGNQLFPIALRTLFSVIPFAPSEVTPFIPLVMVVLGRAISWRDRPFVEPKQPLEGKTRTPEPNPSLNWEVETSAMEQPVQLPASFKPEFAVRLLLVTMYGGWPSNVIAFVRDPVPYLKGKAIESVYNVGWEDVWPPGQLASRVSPMLRNFQLHTSLVQFTSATELADEKRWDKVDPSEFVSRAHLIARSEKRINEEFDFMDRFESTQEDVDPVTSIEEPELPPSNDISRLRHENQLLRLEAQFTDRVRQQYIYHIGRLHRTSLQMYSDEAEIHSLANDSKEQRRIIENLQAELENQKAEASKAKKKHAEWGEGLRTKNERFREEKRLWGKEATLIRQELNDLQAVVKRQTEELALVKNQRFKLQNQLTEAEPKIRRIHDYEVRMKQMQDMLRLWDNDKARFDEAEAQAESWRGRCYQLEQLLRALQLERQEPTRLPPSPPLPPAPLPKPEFRPNIDQYVKAAEDAKKRAEKAERENLELLAQLENLRTRESSGDRSIVWG